MDNLQGITKDPDDYTGKDIIDVEIQWGSSVLYECRVEVETYNNMPVGNAECVAMSRCITDCATVEEAEASVMELAYEDFPHFIKRAAEKKARSL